MSIERSISKTSRTVLSGGASGTSSLSCRLLKTIGVALTLGVLISGCTTSTAPGAASSVPARAAKNPNEAIDGASVSPSQDLKNAATEAYNLHRGILSQVDPAYFDGDFRADINERASSESPAYKNGKSYWNLGTTAYLKANLDTTAIFEKIKTYLESQGYALTSDKRKNEAPMVAITVQFRKKAAVEFIDLSVNGSEKLGLIGMTINTADFPNPPVSEWPKPGQNETWRPDAKLWPAEVGPSESASLSL